MYKIIEDLCVKKGISVNQLSKTVGISSSTFTELKSGRTRELSAKNALKIAKYFNVPVEYLVGEQEIKKSPEEPKLTEGEKKCLELYNRISEDSKELFINMLEAFDKINADSQPMVAEMILVALKNQR